MTAHALQLETRGGAKVALQSVTMDCTIAGLFAHSQLTQRFVNQENQTIEAVYTFPTPLNAVFLGLEVTMGDKVISGVVMADAKADRGYEEAIQEGDAAVLLREVEPGLFSVSVGNILPGETITLRYTYAEQLRWQGSSLRFSLPTTIAPKYGKPSAIGLEPHEALNHAFDTGYAMAVSVKVTGELSRCAIESPTHGIRCRAGQDVVSVDLSTETMAMDRDFVLVLSASAPIRTTALCTPNSTSAVANNADYGKWVASAGFYLPIPEQSANRPGVFQLVIDCSGSMQGDSIRQARIAAQSIIDSLRPEDRFNITVFGSHAESLFDEPAPVNSYSLGAAAHFIAEIAPNLGGTDIRLALRHACPKKASKRSNANVLLITDGEVYDSQEIIESNRHRGHRIFTLGVGSSVSASFLQRLASETGGACELVAPNEQMAEHIVRHFGRMRQLRVREAAVRWGSQSLWSVPSDLSGIFAGDTLHVGAGFYAQPEGDATLLITYEDESTQILETSIVTADVDSAAAAALPRVLAHQRLPQLTDAQRVATAIDYQLLTDGTKCLMTHQRTNREKAEDLPALRNVPHQMAAGHGGLGSVVARDAEHDFLEALCEMPPSSGSDYASVSPSYAFDRPIPIDEEIRFSRRRLTIDDVAEDAGTPIQRLTVSKALQKKLVAKYIHTVEALIAMPSSDWDAHLGLNDAEVAELLRALRKAGFKVR